MKKEFKKKLLLSYLPTIGTFAMVYSYLPQLYLTYSTKNVDGQSLQFWLVLSFSLFTMMLQQIGMIKYEGAKSYAGLIFQILNLSLALAMLIGVLIFK